MRYTESRTTLAGYFHAGLDRVLVLAGPVAVGDVLVVRGQRVEVTAVYGEGPFTVPIGAAWFSAHLPVGEPVRVLRPVEEEQPVRRAWMLRLSPVEVALAAAISDVCEVAQCAGWLPDTEYEVWLLLHDPRPEWGVAGRAGLTAALEKVGAAVQEAGCWIAWPDGAEQALRVELDEWERRYRQWERSSS